MIEWRVRVRQRQVALEPLEWQCLEHYESTPVDPNNITEEQQSLLEAVDRVHQTFNDVARYALSARLIRGADATRLITTVFEQTVRIEYHQVPSDTVAFCCVSHDTTNLLQATLYDAKHHCIDKWFIHVRYRALLDSWLLLAQHRAYVTEAHTRNQMGALYSAMNHAIPIIYYSNFI